MVAKEEALEPEAEVLADGKIQETGGELAGGQAIALGAVARASAARDPEDQPSSRPLPDAMRSYLSAIDKVPLLTAKDEQDLARAIETGREARTKLDEASEGALSPTERRRARMEIRSGDEAKDRFIQANLRLVVSVARRYPTGGLELLDLIQEGNMGLEHAVEKFDWRKGFKFSTYATFWIRQAVSRALDNQSRLIRLPNDQVQALLQAWREANKDEANLEPYMLELHRLSTPVYLDEPRGEGEDTDLNDVLPANTPGPEETLVAAEDLNLLRDLLNILDARTRAVVEQRFGLVDGEGLTYRELGKEFGVTREPVRRLVNKAMEALHEEARNRDYGPAY